LETERWFAVFTHPFAEGRARLQLENQDFRTFLPKRQRTIRHARKLTSVVRPFFPRYLFTTIDLTRHQWRNVNGTVGVVSLVMQGSRPCPAPHGVVETMLAAVDRRQALQLDEEFKVGDSVRLVAGAFADQLAVIDRLDDSGRIQMLLDLLGQRVRVSTTRTDAIRAMHATPRNPRRRAD
jgi:transcriptional antiterminator RfaH